MRGRLSKLTFPRVRTLTRWYIAAGLVLAVVLTMGPLAPAAAVSPVNLVLDGRRLELSPSPFIEGDRIQVPVRTFFEEGLGATVEWDEQTRTVTVLLESRQIRLKIDSRVVRLPGGDISVGLSDVPPRIRDGRTFVPLRLVATTLNTSVRWDDTTRTAVLNSSSAGSGAPASSVILTSIRSGQIITDPLDVQVQVGDDLPSAAEIRLLLLDPATGRGPVVARGSRSASTLRLQVDPVFNGSRFLVAAAYDPNGRFLSGDIVPVEISLTPRVSLTGITPGQNLGGTVSLAAEVNFPATQIKFELKHTETGQITEIATADPQGQFNWTPALAHNGTRRLRAVAYDRHGRTYYSQEVPVEIAVARRLSLTGVSAGKTIDGQVALGVSLNFTGAKVAYLLRDPVSGSEETLARLDSVAGYRWFPVPNQAGSREVVAVVTDGQGQEYRTQPVAVTVSGAPVLLLASVGPNEVLSGKVKLQSIANVPLARIDYILAHRETGARRIIARGTDAQAEYMWESGSGDEGSWLLSARALTPGGDVLESKALPVRVYNGPTYGPKPVVVKDQFLAFASGLALRSQARTGMSAALQVAQAILESGWGQSSPVDKYSGQVSYNLFGIKGTGTAGSVISNTWEEYNGRSFRVDANFRAYGSVEDSWDDHKRLLLGASRYEPFRAVMHDGVQGAWALKRAGYATDSRYPVKLIDLMKVNNLFRLDEVEP